MPAPAGAPSKEERDRHLKDLGDLLQAAGADAVGPFLVFLNLLECQSKCVRNIGLAHVEHETPHAHAAAYIFVGWIDSAPGHLSPLAARPV